MSTMFQCLFQRQGSGPHVGIILARRRAQTGFCVSISLSKKQRNASALERQMIALVKHKGQGLSGYQLLRAMKDEKVGYREIAASLWDATRVDLVTVP